MKDVLEDKQREVLDIQNQTKNNTKYIYIENYGCQMNFSDSEIVASIMFKNGYNTTLDIKKADVIFVNTCSVRAKAERTVLKRLTEYKKIKKTKPSLIIGVLGCMAERMKNELLEDKKMVDIVVGPDAYRNLPNLVKEVEGGSKAINVLLSREETYADISPIRFASNGISAFVSITRGCDNMCSFCIVPFTRGRERSRNPDTILNEIKELYHNGYKEVTLLGQNVDSYLWYGGGQKKDFINATKEQRDNAINFHMLLELVAKENSNMRIRFMTSNPQDITDKVITTVAKYDNICNYFHLPVQSGSDRLLKHMNRGHSRKEYISLIDKIRNFIPDCAISHDMMTGYPTETEQDHKDTLSLMDYIKYDTGFMFKYSERPGTLASKKYPDDVDEKDKKRRLQEIIDLQRSHSLYKNKQFIGKEVEVLVEGKSKKNRNFLSGRNSQNTVVVFPKGNHKKGDFVKIKIKECTSATLIGG